MSVISTLLTSIFGGDTGGSDDGGGGPGTGSLDPATTLYPPDPTEDPDPNIDTIEITGKRPAPPVDNPPLLDPTDWIKPVIDMPPAVETPEDIPTIEITGTRPTPDPVIPPMIEPKIEDAVTLPDPVQDPATDPGDAAKPPVPPIDPNLPIGAVPYPPTKTVTPTDAGGGTAVGGLGATTGIGGASGTIPGVAPTLLTTGGDYGFARPRSSTMLA